MQLGDIPELQHLNDFYGATVVVPTRRHVDPAAEEVCSEFAEAEVRRDRNLDPRAFPYDDVHVIAQLAPLTGASARDDPVRLRRFEIQIRTGLQYAWWWATHDTIYKGDVVGWRAQRLASQARASLELLDDVLADLQGAAELQPLRSSTEEERFREIASWLQQWDESNRPVDVRRFCETVEVYLRVSGLRASDVQLALEAETNRDVVNLPGITPAQAVFIAIFRLIPTAFREALRENDIAALITDEMQAACPELSAFEAPDRVRLER